MSHKPDCELCAHAVIDPKCTGCELSTERNEMTTEPRQYFSKGYHCDKCGDLIAESGNEAGIFHLEDADNDRQLIVSKWCNHCIVGAINYHRYRPSFKSMNEFDAVTVLENELKNFHFNQRDAERTS